MLEEAGRTCIELRARFRSLIELVDSVWPPTHQSNVPSRELCKILLSTAQYAKQKQLPLTAALICTLHLFDPVWGPGPFAAVPKDLLDKRRSGAGVEAPEQLLFAVQLTAQWLCSADIGRLIRDILYQENCTTYVRVCGLNLEAIRRCGGTPAQTELKSRHFARESSNRWFYMLAKTWGSKSEVVNGWFRFNYLLSALV